MSGVDAFCLCIVIWGVWVALAVQSQKLRKLFLAKYPREAQQLTPLAGSNMRDPENFLFFFRQTSLPMLKADPELWRQRQRLKLLALLSILTPLLCLATIGVVGLLETR